VLQAGRVRQHLPGHIGFWTCSRSEQTYRRKLWGRTGHGQGRCRLASFLATTLAPMAAKKDKRRIKQGRQRPGEPQRLPDPRTRLKDLFTTMKAVTSAGDRAIAQTPAEGSELVRFDAEVLVRGVNAVKSARLLLENAHWESAAGPVRQLFELLVNVEHIAAQPDREETVFRFAKFGLLQIVRSQRVMLDYERATGRPVDQGRAATLDGLLEHGFPEFRKVDAKGRVVWSRSWCGKNVKALTRGSRNALRHAQYEQLFVLWSEQVHAAPAALMGGLFPSDATGDVADVVALDDLRVAETGSIAVTLFAELWRVLPTVAPLDDHVLGGWATALIRQAQTLGAPMPVSVDGASGSFAGDRSQGRD